MNATIEAKLKELCTAIAQDAELQTARQQAEAFLADEEAVDLYRDLMSRSRDMQHRQRNGEDIHDEDVQQLVELKHAADNHSAIQSFHSAQDTLQGVAEMVSAYVSKTLENGKVPTEEDLAPAGGCGAGCGCH